MNLLITGVAGFIGSTLARRVLDRGDTVIGIDNLNDYYDVSLKLARLELLKKYAGKFRFYKADITDKQDIENVFSEHRIERIMHLAAQAGVRYSLENPAAYIDTNLVGFAYILEAARQATVEHLVYASSSSVYGANTKLPAPVHRASVFYGIRSVGEAGHGAFPVYTRHHERSADSRLQPGTDGARFHLHR